LADDADGRLGDGHGALFALKCIEQRAIAGGRAHAGDHRLHQHLRRDLAPHVLLEFGTAVAQLLQEAVVGGFVKCARDGIQHRRDVANARRNLDVGGADPHPIRITVHGDPGDHAVEQLQVQAAVDGFLLGGVLTLRPLGSQRELQFAVEFLGRDVAAIDPGHALLADAAEDVVHTPNGEGDHQNEQQQVRNPAASESSHLCEHDGIR